MGYIYLASPYSALTLQKRVDRFMAAQDAAIFLISNGHSVYSPIVHWHHIAEMVSLPKDFQFWRKQNDDLLAGAEFIYLLCLDGYKKSEGIRYELEQARKQDKRLVVMQNAKKGQPLAIYEAPFKTWTPEEILK